MPISLTCPSCDRGLKVKDELAGRKIKCPKCSEVIVVPADEEAVAAGKSKIKARATEDDDERPRSKKVEREEEDDEQEEEEERPRKKKKKKKKGAGVLRYVIGGVVLAALIVVLVIILMNKNKPVEKKEEPVAQQPQEPDEPEEAKPLPKQKAQPKSLAQNIRQAALRPERQNELKTIGTFFKLFYDTNNKNPRTEKEFLDSMRRDAPVVVKAIEKKEYILNLNVNMRSGAPRGIIAYDPLIDGPGHQAVGTDLSVSPIPTAELNKLLGK